MLSPFHCKHVVLRLCARVCMFMRCKAGGPFEAGTGDRWLEPLCLSVVNQSETTEWLSFSKVGLPSGETSNSARTKSVSVPRTLALALLPSTPPFSPTLSCCSVFSLQVIRGSDDLHEGVLVKVGAGHGARVIFGWVASLYHKGRKGQGKSEMQCIVRAHNAEHETCKLKVMKVASEGEFAKWKQAQDTLQPHSVEVCVDHPLFSGRFMIGGLLRSISRTDSVKLSEIHASPKLAIPAHVHIC